MRLKGKCSWYKSLESTVTLFLIWGRRSHDWKDVPLIEPHLLSNVKAYHETPRFLYSVILRELKSRKKLDHGRSRVKSCRDSVVGEVT